jgi:hypothetical protein
MGCFKLLLFVIFHLPNKYQMTGEGSPEASETSAGIFYSLSLLVSIILSSAVII